MLAQRATQQALRRFAAGKPSMASQMTFNKFITPAIGSSFQSRPVATQKLTQKDSYDILVEQRKQRPVAPHLTIYKPQIPWILSSLNRVTGVALSGPIYLFSLAYLASPLFGWHMDSASIAAAFATWPVAAKVLTKFVVALPFTFHSFNGLRHLVWDTASAFKNVQVIRTGQAVIGATLVGSLALALFM